MSSYQKMSFRSALLVSINTIIGAGVYINVQPLIKVAGAFSFLGYLLGWIILFPFILTLANLASKNPVSGGLYVYSKKYIHPIAGLISGWAFFVGKSASSILLIHTFVNYFLQPNVPILQNVPTLFIDYAVVLFLIAIHTIGVTIGGKIQWFFVTAKMTPIAFVIITGILFKNRFTLPVDTFQFSQAIQAIPIALFALIGGEIICSITHLIQDPERNVKRVIIWSSVITGILIIFFQTAFFVVLGDTAGQIPVPLFALAHAIMPSNVIIPTLLHALAFTSIIGGAFSIFTSNSWNLHTIAHDNHTPFKKVFTYLNNKEVPVYSLLFEASISCFLIFVTRNQSALQSMVVFSVFISFLLSAIAAFISAKKEFPTKLIPIIPTLSIGTCLYTLYLCLGKLRTSGVSFPFLAILLIGITIALVKNVLRTRSKRKEG